jgi:hypothetical protein
VGIDGGQRTKPPIDRDAAADGQSCSLASWEQNRAIAIVPVPFHNRPCSCPIIDIQGRSRRDACGCFLGLAACQAIALELVRGGEPTHAAIIVAEDDRQLFEVPLSEHGG